MQKHLDECKDKHLEMTLESCMKLEAVVNNLQLVVGKIYHKPVFIPPPEMNVDNFEKQKMMTETGTVLPSTFHKRTNIIIMPFHSWLGHACL